MTNTRGKISSMGTVGTFLNGRACSDTLFHVISCAFDQPMKHEETATMPFAGGILQHGYQCGMIWGATLAAGAQAYRLLGPGPQTETRAIRAAERLVDSFHRSNNNINCMEITNIDKTSTTMQMIIYFLIKGGSIGCFRRAAKYAKVAFSEINASFSEEQGEAPSGPISCAAELAKKIGASDLHAAMTAGLAGGIGLSGGACGALGAAIWITGMNSLKEGTRKLDFKNPSALDRIDKFIKSTNYEFECSGIVGRKFKDVDDHATYLQEGGCSQIIEVLAT